MSSITLRILDGANRGQVFGEIEAPVTIGREEGNTIQLNDERVSRYHLKIQRDHDDLVLTDLESTNGSRVNNEEVQLRILRKGDLISIGRSVILFGDREDVDLNNVELSETPGSPNVKNFDRTDDGLSYGLAGVEPPKLPERLSPGQAAQLSEVIEYLHLHLRHVINDAEITQRGQAVQLPHAKWQQILELQSRLAEYIDRVGKPTI
jgi:pSer/pThr/pTyr-binding forkhead associated (FHA) protein